MFSHTTRIAILQRLVVGIVTIFALGFEVCDAHVYDNAGETAGIYFNSRATEDLAPPRFHHHPARIGHEPAVEPPLPSTLLATVDRTDERVPRLAEVVPGRIGVLPSFLSRAPPLQA